MRSKIIRDLTLDAIISILILEGVLFGIKFLLSEYLSKLPLTKTINDYYILIAIGIGLISVLFFGFHCMLCLKKYKIVMDRNGFSDATYYEYYKQANKCCNYRVNGDFVFVNTTHGIICMEKCDITDRRSRRVKHTRRRRGKNIAGNTTYVMHTHEYYTYHFDLYTEHGHFKNTVANNAVLEDLNKLFYGH